MKLAVCVKEVLDTRLPLEVSADGAQIRQRGTEPVVLINPADRAALEVALDLASRDRQSRVEAFSVCEEGQEGALRFALARGAHGAERVVPHPEPSGPPWTALLLAARLGEGGYDLICCGDQTLDGGSAMVGPLLAEILGFSQVTSVSKIESVEGRKLVVERKLDRGYRDLVEVELPAVITVTEDTAEPRYVSARRLESVKGIPIPSRSVTAQAPEAKLPSWARDVRKGPARSRVKKKFVPDAKASAADRMKMIMAGGAAAAPRSGAETSVVEGDAEYLSEQMFRFLKHHGFIS